MGHMVIGISLVFLALLAGVGLWLEVGSGVLDPDPPLEVGGDPSLPDDGQDGNVVITLGKGDKTFRLPHAPGDPEDWEIDGRLSAKERKSVDVKGYLPYVVQPGETLSAIAKRYLGKPHLWQQILAHNRVLLMRPEDLRAGMSIRIPLWLKEDF